MDGIRGCAFVSLILSAAVLFAGCAEEQYPADLWKAQHPQSGAGADASVNGSTPRAHVCYQAKATPLPARLEAMQSNTATTSAPVVLVSDLLERFTPICGSCHGASANPPGPGGFQITTATAFATQMTAAVLAHVTSNVACPYTPDPTNPQDPMPPCSSPNGMPYSQRSDTDSVKQFAELVKAWLAAGSPPSFTPPSASGPGATSQPDGGAVSLSASPQVGNALTNVGNCIPSVALVGTESEKSAALDAKFAGLSAATSGTASAMIGLPEHIRDTDLFTFDSETLAAFGVIAYAPAYPLWSDNAGKLRHVRVPRGTSIAFHKASQQFTIPTNTRFYKTFMQQVVDSDGSLRYRKLETRIIVSRPDTIHADGTASSSSLFGTYRWNDDESDAVLVETPLNSGLPFADTVFLYDTDQPLAQAVLRGEPSSPEEALLEARAARHYAIPSSVRCIQCHSGSASQSFVLGFTPVQINRRESGHGGVIEPTGQDELTQLQRFIDYGLITGLESPSDILPLEQLEADRRPRNDHELVAQGYLLGNCAHCHNPRGLATVQNPMLNGILDFMPSDNGGVFQFPLDRYSPRIGRGLSGSTPIPYITPSLVDLPRSDPQSGEQAADVFTQGTGPDSLFWAIYAPWRSLIYRNVDSTFAYTDDLALYPHMPMNTAGYDPRAKQILGDWMVSIPAARKRPEIPEYAYQTDGTPTDNVGGPVVDSSPQPYVEVAPGMPGYGDAVAAANTRMTVFHTGTNPVVPVAATIAPYSRYRDLGVTDDIIDPAVLADPICTPVPVGERTQNTYPFPEHPHWVNTDLTLPPGPWAPLQTNWVSVLVEQHVPPPVTGCSSPAGAEAAYEDQVNAVSILQTATLAEVRDYATTPVPFGLWKAAPSCNFSSASTVQSFTGANRPHWMDVTNPASNAPVYQETPGAAVYKMICINCHGPNADANGRLAQNLATMTGGGALVANFRAGLFGPVGASVGTSNRHVAFGSLPADATTHWTSASDDDRAARYLAWMALGGTPVQIPVQILEIVAVTKVLDQQRVLAASSLSANMLSQAKALCLGILGPSYRDSLFSPTLDPRPGHGYLDARSTHLNDTLLFENGDAELWMHLCASANPAPVHILRPSDNGSLSLAVKTVQDSTYNLAIDSYAPGTIMSASDYPTGVPVGTGSGGSAPNLDPTNLWPWCIDDGTASGAQKDWITSAKLPICPDAVKSMSHACATQTVGATCFGNEEANRWAVRGAVNAGLAVYLYVQSIENTGPSPDYDQCGLLK